MLTSGEVARSGSTCTASMDAGASKRRCSLRLAVTTTSSSRLDSASCAQAAGSWTAQAGSAANSVTARIWDDVGMFIPVRFIVWGAAAKDPLFKQK
jgi:hypothetical protein